MTRTSAFGFAAALVAGALAACDSDSSGPSPTPVFISASADTNPSMSISSVVTVTARNYDSAAVRFWTGAGSAQMTPAVAFDGDSVLAMPVLGLDTAAVYSFEVNLFTGDTAQAVDTLSFASGSLPAWVPAIGAAGTDTTPGYLLLSLPNGPVIIDNQGKVLWYAESPGGILNSFKAQANGLYTSLGVAAGPGHVLFNNLGQQVGTLSCQGFTTRFHDILVLANGDYFIMCDDTRVMDLSAIGGVAGANVTGTVVQKISAGGTLLFEWNAFDHFQITDLAQADRTGPSVNFTHGNGLALDRDGNLLLSSRSLNEVTKIDLATGDIIWRLGGLQNQFTFVNDTKGTFERQHGLKLAGIGEIQMLDNGAAAPSRFVRYALDEVALTATLVMEYIDSPTTFATVGGATDYYPNTHGIVTYGPVGRVAEVDEQGNLAWEVTGVAGTYVFRVQRLTSLYDPRPITP